MVVPAGTFQRGPVTGGYGLGWLAWAGTGILLAFTGGCTMHSPAARGSADGRMPDEHPIRLVADDWPKRDTESLPSLVQRTPSEITWWKADPESPSRGDTTDLRLRGPQAIVSYTGVHGVGVIRVLDEPPGSGRASAGPGIGRQSNSGPIRFVSLSKHPDRPVDQRIKRLEDWVQRRAQRPTRAGVSMNDPEVLAMLWEGTGVRLVPPKQGVPTAGTIVHMPGLGSMQYEQPVLDELTARGWWIVRIATPRVWWFEDRTYEITSEEEIEPLGGQIGRLVDDLLAEPAYAAEASLDYLSRYRADIPTRPVVLLGMSAGALMMPAVAARLGDRVDAMVLIGAGANLLKISQESELTDGGIKITWAPGIDQAAAKQRLYSAYLEHAKLDPYTAGAAVRDVPTLLMLANFDGIVPANCGRLLWERMGRPERYTTPFGHELLFWQLSMHTGRIADWIDRVSTSERRHAALAPDSQPQAPQ